MDPHEPTGMLRVGGEASSLRQLRLDALAGRTRREGVHLSPGARVPGTPYRLVRWLGDGGMGVVYEAEHVDIGRRVAIKILRPEVCDDPHVLQLFRDEARAAARIGSAQIVEVHDFAELPDGRLLYAMELLHGQPLAREIAARPLAPARVIPILRQVCKGLASAHAVHIVHRDIKPDNIFLADRDSRRDVVKILDFGISVLLVEPTATEGDILGTPTYLAPEILAGKPFDARVDMYALGCTAYEMLTGRPPFQGTVKELLFAHLHTPPPSIATLCQDRDVPVALAAVVVRCLAKQPEDRYDDMDDLEAALCEAQIACGIETTWDDLALPNVDADRRDLLLRRMPDPTLISMIHAPQRRPSYLIAALTGALMLGSAAVVVRLLTAAPAAVVDPEVARLAGEARAAAARVAFVYPAPDDEAPTAYQQVRALEALEGPQAQAGEAMAASLRGEFAGTLGAFGDRLWDRPGGHEFAVDAYAQALLFDPDLEPAASRADLTPGQLARLARKAATRDFTATELIAAEPLVVLVDGEVIAETPALALARERAVRRTRSRDVALAQAIAPAASTPTAPAPAATSARGPTVAQLLEQARSAVRGGKGDEAERLFEKILARDARNVGALTGMTELYFNRGAYARALRFGARSVKLAPNDAALRVLVGDAAFKEFRYEEAREAYRQAGRLGHPEAAGRLAKVAGKLGG